MKWAQLPNCVPRSVSERSEESARLQAARLSAEQLRWLPLPVHTHTHSSSVAKGKFENPGPEHCWFYWVPTSPAPSSRLPFFPGQWRLSHSGRTEEILAANPGGWGSSGKVQNVLLQGPLIPCLPTTLAPRGPVASTASTRPLTGVELGEAGSGTCSKDKWRFTQAG